MDSSMEFDEHGFEGPSRRRLQSTTRISRTTRRRRPHLLHSSFSHDNKRERDAEPGGLLGRHGDRIPLQNKDAVPAARPVIWHKPFRLSVSGALVHEEFRLLQQYLAQQLWVCCQEH